MVALQRGSSVSWVEPGAWRWSRGRVMGFVRSWPVSATSGKMDHDTYSALLGAIAYLSLWVMLLVLWLGRK